MQPTPEIGCYLTDRTLKNRHESRKCVFHRCVLFSNRVYVSLSAKPLEKLKNFVSKCFYSWERG